MKNIQVKILSGDLDGTCKFLAKLTQRGHLIKDINDITKLYKDNVYTDPSEQIINLPHSTLYRMNYLTIAIYGLSTKAVSQLRTHATSLTFLSTSTQYSKFNLDDTTYLNFDMLDESQQEKMRIGYNKIHSLYDELIADGVDKDIASYLLPQGLRKTLIISGTLDHWRHMISLRLCKRNSIETQYVCKLIYNEIKRKFGKVYTIGMLPKCCTTSCQEGKFCCKQPYKESDFDAL